MALAPAKSLQLSRGWALSVLTCSCSSPSTLPHTRRTANDQPAAKLQDPSKMPNCRILRLLPAERSPRILQTDMPLRRQHQAAQSLDPARPSILTFRSYHKGVGTGYGDPYDQMSDSRWSRWWSNSCISYMCRYYNRVLVIENTVMSTRSHENFFYLSYYGSYLHGSAIKWVGNIRCSNIINECQKMMSLKLN